MAARSRGFEVTYIAHARRKMGGATWITNIQSDNEIFNTRNYIRRISQDSRHFEPRKFGATQAVRIIIIVVKLRSLSAVGKETEEEDVAREAKQLHEEGESCLSNWWIKDWFRSTSRKTSTRVACRAGDNMERQASNVKWGYTLENPSTHN